MPKLSPSDAHTLAVVFFEEHSPMSKLIQFFSRSRISHVGYLAPSGCLIEPWVTPNRLVNLKWRVNALSDHHPGSRYRVLTKRVDAKTRRRVEALFRFMAWLHVPYDWLGVLAFVIPMRLKINGRLFCSEGVQDVLRYCGVVPAETPGWKVNPDMLHALLLANGWAAGRWTTIKGGRPRCRSTSDS